MGCYLIKASLNEAFINNQSKKCPQKDKSKRPVIAGLIFIENLLQR